MINGCKLFYCRIRETNEKIIIISIMWGVFIVAENYDQPLFYLQMLVSLYEFYETNKGYEK